MSDHDHDDDHKHDDSADYEAMQITISKNAADASFSATIRLADHLQDCAVCRSFAIANAVSAMGNLHHQLMCPDDDRPMMQYDENVASGHKH